MGEKRENVQMGSVDQFREFVAKDDFDPRDAVLRFAAAEPSATSVAARTFRFVLSDSTVDASGDVIAQTGWDLRRFVKNAPALWSHDASVPPIGKWRDVGVVNGKLIGTLQFAPPGVHALADTVAALVEHKFLNACSVGFRPTKWQFSSDKNRPNGIDFLQQELLEASLCAIPCNPSSLIEARSKGLNLAPLGKWSRELGLDRSNPVSDAARAARVQAARQLRIRLIRDEFQL